MKTRLALVSACLWAAPVAGQSLYSGAGLGVPVEALGGRARAMGSLGIGLFGSSIMPTDPASVARNFLPTGVMVSAPSWVDYEEGPATGEFRGARFPLMGIAYPVFDGMMSVQLGSYLDQHYRTEVTGSVDLGGSTVGTLDTFDQDGAVSNLTIGYARMIDERTAIGVNFGRYAGSVVRTLTRAFDTESLPVENYIAGGRWTYSGYSVTAGVSADLSDIVRVAGSVQLPTQLDANPDETTTGSSGSFDLPIQLRVGASARLAPGLIMSVSGALADWSGAEEDLREPVSVGTANAFGVGLELARARLFGRSAPLRFGYRRGSLPFTFDGAGTESTWSGGLGLDLNDAGQVLLAGADFGLERGTRFGGGVREEFWRLTISLIVSGS